MSLTKVATVNLSAKLFARVAQFSKNPGHGFDWFCEGAVTNDGSRYPSLFNSGYPAVAQPSLLFPDTASTSSGYIQVAVGEEPTFFPVGSMVGSAVTNYDGSNSYGASSSQLVQYQEYIQTRLHNAAPLRPGLPTQDVTLDLGAMLTGVQGLDSTIVRFTPAQYLALYDALIANWVRLVPVWYATRGSIETYATGRPYVFGAKQAAVIEKVPGEPGEITFNMQVRGTVYRESTNGLNYIVIDPFVDPANTCAVAARSAMVAHDIQLKKYIAKRAEGHTVPPMQAARPTETTASCLSQEERKYADDWWAATEQMITAANRPVSTTVDEAYANYVAGGGTANKGAWTANADSRAASAAGTDQMSSSFLPKLYSGLSWAADKSADAISWLGDSALDLAKTWGPMGTVGAFAGFKAVNAASNNKWLLPLVIAGGAILLLK